MAEVRKENEKGRHEVQLERQNSCYFMTIFCRKEQQQQQKHLQMTVKVFIVTRFVQGFHPYTDFTAYI